MSVRAARATPAAPSARNERVERLFFLYGNKEADVHSEKLRVLRELIPSDDDRRENVVDIEPSPNRPLALKDAAPQILVELGQASLFGDSRRVVVAHQVSELFATWSRRSRRTGSAKAKTPAAAAEDDKAEDAVSSFVDAAARLLRATPNALIFVGIEDETKGRRVNEDSPLVAALGRMGVVRVFSAKSYRFELGDSIMARSLPSAMRIATIWRHEDSRADYAIHRALVEDVRCLIQAFIMSRAAMSGGTDPTLERVLFPSDLKPNLTTIHEFRRKKYFAGLENYPNVEDLLEAMRGLLDIQKALYPTGDEAYIPDVGFMMDVWLAKLLGRRK